MRISIVTKIVSLTIFFLLTVALITTGVALKVIGENIQEDVLKKQNLNLRIASAIFKDKIEGFEFSYNSENNVAKLVLPAIPQFSDHTLIDSVGKVTGETATIFAYGKDDDYWRVTTNIVKADGSRAVGTPLGKGSAAYPFIKEGKTYMGEANILGKDYFTVYAPIFDNGGKVIGILYCGVEKSQMVAVLDHIRGHVIEYVGGALLVILLIVTFIMRRMLNVLPVITGQIESLALGNSDISIESGKRRDEIGQMQKAMLSLKETVAKAFQRAQMINEMAVPVIVADLESEKVIYANKHATKLVSLVEDALGFKSAELLGQKVDVFSKGKGRISNIIHDESQLPYHERLEIGKEFVDMVITPIVDKQGKYFAPMLTFEIVTREEQLALDFDASVKGSISNLKRALNVMRADLDKVSEIAVNNSAISTTVASAAEESGTNVQSVASAVEELSSSIREISAQVTRSVSLTKGAVSLSEDSKKRADELNKAGERIGEIVGMISDIAEQTNLLALNATIEAARAGEAGKGFAVVATEVKNLAVKTASATKDVADEISQVRAAVNLVLESIGKTTQNIEEIDDIFTSVSAAIEEQSAATGEINRNVQQAATGTREVVTNIHKVNEGSNTTGVAMKSILGKAADLDNESKKLDDVATDFLVKIRQ